MEGTRAAAAVGSVRVREVFRASRLVASLLLGCDDGSEVVPGWDSRRGWEFVGCVFRVGIANVNDDDVWRRVKTAPRSR